MQIQLIRSATLRVEYAHQRFVIDPYLAAKHSQPSYAGKSPDPLVDLPCSPEEVLDGIDWALISHLHSDHATVSRQDLRAYANAHGIQPEQLLIPADGEKLSFAP